MRDIRDGAFYLLVAASTLALAWILWPFSGAILWAVVFAVLFAPLQRRFSKLMKNRATPAALATEFIILLLVIVPLLWIGSALVDEVAKLYQRIQSRELDVGRYLQLIFDALPDWTRAWLDRAGLPDLEAVRERLRNGLMEASQFIAARAVTLGQSTAWFFVKLFVMLYLLFFLLRDGDALMRHITRAIPLRAVQKHALFQKFTVAIRATIKGSIVIAILQGAFGGIILWVLGIGAPLLWGTLMAILSLIPMLGAALVWIPVAIYLFAIGEIAKAIVLIAFGTLVIGLVDNVVRPILVGKDAKMPDYIVLLSTLGGVAMTGANGFLIGPIIAAMFLSVWQTMSEAQQPDVEIIADEGK